MQRVCERFYQSNLRRFAIKVNQRFENGNVGQLFAEFLSRLDLTDKFARIKRKVSQSDREQGHRGYINSTNTYSHRLQSAGSPGGALRRGTGSEVCGRTSYFARR